ncbi:MAG: 3-methyladenine DNA glycosylase [Ponticaulis sp.]|nr:3-methyladenine DNA glycosylase [Ponticaulis sp.]|tara:strand:+ start:69238 stop:69909 length:672 start_codon:yes stop_codon:yes gene_type:complete
MISFQVIEDRAVTKHGRVKLEETLARRCVVRSPDEIAATPNDRFLAEATRMIFQAGFNWDVVDKKWPNFEKAFNGFDVHYWAMMADEEMGRLMQDGSIIRNAMRLASVGKNAVYFRDIITEHGSVGAFFASWDPDQYFENLVAMRKRTHRLGGTSGMIFLRRMGIESLVFSNDVVRALIANGVVEKLPNSKRDMAATQDAVSKWRSESGRTLSEISQILAMSV